MSKLNEVLQTIMTLRREINLKLPLSQHCKHIPVIKFPLNYFLADCYFLKWLIRYIVDIPKKDSVIFLDNHHSNNFLLWA